MVFRVLGNLDLLHKLSEGGSITHSILSSNSNFLRSLSHVYLFLVIRLLLVGVGGGGIGRGGGS